jgi:hypothetical protein
VLSLRVRGDRRGDGALPLGEGRDEGAHAGQGRGSVLVLLEGVRGVALVVAADELVLVGHADAVHGEPVDHADLVALEVLEPEQGHVLVDIVLVLGPLLSGVLEVRGRRTAELP